MAIRRALLLPLVKSVQSALVCRVLAPVKSLSLPARNTYYTRPGAVKYDLPHVCVLCVERA